VKLRMVGPPGLPKRAESRCARAHARHIRERPKTCRTLSGGSRSQSCKTASINPGPTNRCGHFRKSAQDARRNRSVASAQSAAGARTVRPAEASSVCRRLTLHTTASLIAGMPKEAPGLPERKRQLAAGDPRKARTRALIWPPAAKSRKASRPGRTRMASL
jgi:hypothetical protein